MKYILDLGMPRANWTESTLVWWSRLIPLEWTVIVFVRWRLLPTWSNWRKDFQLPKYYILKYGGNLSITGLYRRYSNTQVCLVFNCIIRSKYHNSRHSHSRSLYSFNCKSMVRGAVSSNDLVLWWCRWLHHVQFTFIFEIILEVDVI